MSAGKLATQAGHATLGAFLKASPTRQAAYHADGIGTKVCLTVPGLSQLLLVHHKALQLGLPTVLIEDTGCNTCFHGVPTITAVGIGPILSAEAPFLRRLQLHA